MYRCRVIKLGAKSAGNLDYVAYPGFTCQSAPSASSSGSTSSAARNAMPASSFLAMPIREVFLGTLVLGDENRALQYGQDETRDVAGYVERIGPARWRLVMPQPHFEFQLDVMELVPMTTGAR